MVIYCAIFGLAGLFREPLAHPIRPKLWQGRYVRGIREHTTTRNPRRRTRLAGGLLLAIAIVGVAVSDASGQTPLNRRGNRNRPLRRRPAQSLRKTKHPKKANLRRRHRRVQNNPKSRFRRPIVQSIRFAPEPGQRSCPRTRKTRTRTLPTMCFCRPTVARSKIFPILGGC